MDYITILYMNWYFVWVLTQLIDYRAISYCLFYMEARNPNPLEQTSICLIYPRNKHKNNPLPKGDKESSTSGDMK